MKKFSQIISLLLVLMIAASALTFVSCGSKQEKAETKYHITFVCVDKDGKEQTFKIDTDEKYLRGALEQENLIKGDESQYGLMVNEVCGIRADYTLDGAYWALYIGEAMGYTVTGVASDQELYVGHAFRELREVLARDKDFFKVLMHAAPTYGGEQIPITGPVDKSHE